MSETVLSQRRSHAKSNGRLRLTALFLADLGEKIFADRYARKTYDNFVLGDKVLVKHNGQSLFSTVLSLSDDSVEVKLENGDEVTCDKNNVAKPIETPIDMFQRVAQAVAEAEENKAKWAAEFLSVLENFQFIPGGRILSAAGNDNLTCYNCFVLLSPKDSRDGIITTLQPMVEIMSRGGGVGINISSLRPKDSPVHGVSGRSSGAVSWGALYRKPKASVSAANMLCYWIDLSRWIKKRRSGFGHE